MKEEESKADCFVERPEKIARNAPKKMKADDDDNDNDDVDDEEYKPQ